MAQYDRNINFILDTGADVTTIQPLDAHQLLGDDLFEIDFDRDLGSVGVAGTATASSLGVVRPAVFSLRTDRGGHISVNAHAVIAQPVPFEVSGVGNWNKPSVLGRDTLSRFGFRLDYRASDPVLLEVDR